MCIRKLWLPAVEEEKHHEITEYVLAIVPHSDCNSPDKCDHLMRCSHYRRTGSQGGIWRRKSRRNVNWGKEWICVKRPSSSGKRQANTVASKQASAADERKLRQTQETEEGRYDVAVFQRHTSGKNKELQTEIPGSRVGCCGQGQEEHHWEGDWENGLLQYSPCSILILAWEHSGKVWSTRQVTHCIAHSNAVQSLERPVLLDRHIYWRFASTLQVMTHWELVHLQSWCQTADFITLKYAV